MGAPFGALFVNRDRDQFIARLNGVDDVLATSDCDSQSRRPASLDTLVLLGTSRRKVRARERLAKAARSLAYSLDSFRQPTTIPR